MTIVATTIESNGWVLAVRGTWGATPGAWEFGGSDRVDGRFLSSAVDQFPLDPGGTPKIVLSVQDAGFDRVGGQAVANSNRPRTVIATKAIRRAFPNQSQLDETDHGGGERTVRFALSERIYATSVVTTASFLTNWKQGQAGGATASIANGSTIAAPLPMFRWANEPWPLVQGTVGVPNHSARVELLVGAHHPEANGSDLHQACAAVQLVAYDGTTSKTFWFAAPQTSPLYADNLRCWGGVIDLSGLSAGPITVHATVYPWVGASRATGTSHSTSATAALATAWGAPFHIAYDPTGSVYLRKFLFVDPASTNIDPYTSGQLAAVTLHDSIADAKAAPLSAQPGTYIMALAKLATRPTLAARNGFASSVRNIAYCEIILKDGANHDMTSSLGASTSQIYSGANTGHGYLVVRGDPDASDPRANTFFRSPTAAGTNAAADRVKFRDLTLEMGTQNFFTIRSNSWATFENCNIRGKAGETSGGLDIFASGSFVSQFNTRCRNYGAEPRGFLLRNNQRTRGLDTSSLATAINVTINTPESGESAPSRTVTAFGGAALVDDAVIWNCRAFNWQGGLFAAAQGNFGADVSTRRILVVNTLIEGIDKLLAIGETNNGQLKDSLFDGLTMVGGRFNFHNDSDAGGTTANCAVRVAGTTVITIGLLAHGLLSGDTITTTGFATASLNRVAVPVTVLDANRFTYVASASVGSVASTISGTITIVSAVNTALNGTSRPILRDNLRHTGNIIRNSVFARNGTKHDIFDSAPNLTGSWELLYGVGYRGNVTANRTTGSPADFQYAFPGIGSEAETSFGDGTQTGVASWGVNWHGFKDDNSFGGPEAGSPTTNGDYRPEAADLDGFTPSRLINKGRLAVIDQTLDGQTRSATFSSGAFGAAGVTIVASSLRPSEAVHPHLSDATRLSWFGTLIGADSEIGLGGSDAALRPEAAVSRIASRRALRVEAESRGIRAED